jgi:hypothetical protein
MRAQYVVGLALVAGFFACTKDFDQFFEGSSPASSGTGATGAQGGGGMGGGGLFGGGGSGPECDMPSDCPGMATTCAFPTCVGNQCGSDTAPSGTPCTEGGGAVCDGNGLCVECVDAAQCTPPDVCAMNACVPPNCTDMLLDGGETDVDCGGPDCNPCPNGDMCGMGTDCESVFCDNGTCAPCANSGDCDNASYCDPAVAGGTCVPDKVDGAPCADDTECVSGACPNDDGICCDNACNGNCESCQAALTGGTDGVCANVIAATDPDNDCNGQQVCDDTGACAPPCGQLACNFGSQCSPAATNGVCADASGDCDTTTCVGATPGPPIEAGAPAALNFNTLQDDGNTAGGGQRWFCNVTLPVSGAGILESWEMLVDSNGSMGETAQLAVIRCTMGGGGNGGPVLSNCSRVGLGPAQTISGNGLQTFSLAGATQLDGNGGSPTGIVVQAGDWICADSNAFNIRFDCNATTTAGGCPGPNFNLQFLTDLDNAAQPFALGDSMSNGTLMIKATGTGAGNPGTCSATADEPDTTLCNMGGDTCCGGACVVGPNGAGTCN